MHVSDGYGSVEILSGTSVSEANLTVGIDGNTFPKLSVISVLGKILVNFFGKLCLVK